MFTVSWPNPCIKYPFITKICQKSCYRRTFSDYNPQKVNYYNSVKLLKLIAIWKNFFYNI